MKNRIRFIAIGIASVVLTGCSYVKSLFPDKERDYQYTTEIPMINYPADLRKNQSAASVSETSPPPTAPIEGSETNANTDSSDQPPADDNTSTDTADESDGQDKVSSVEIIKYDDGESRLRLGAGESKSWRAVNKALSHNTIEVTERNHDQAQITIQYDPDEKKAQDDSFMDEVSFIFNGIDINDKEYVLKLEGHDQQTDVIVLNEEHLPLLNDDAALRLLKLLASTIKADLAEKAK
jgi:outer membrane protein assembly factor BamC